MTILHPFFEIFPVIFSSLYLSGLASIAAMATLAFAISIRCKDNAIADIFWGPFQLALVASAIFWKREGLALPQWTLIFALILWSGRLSLHLWNRRKKSQKEDWRYAKMRKNWGKAAPLHSFFKVFLLQGFFAWVLGWPILAALARVHWNFGPFQIIGFAIFAVGFFWEAIGDAQLQRFKENSQGDAILTSGLWSYTRHPNYTGEIMIWWGIYLFTETWQVSWLTLISPLFITFMIARVSGVAMIKERYKDHPQYLEYMNRTPALIPKFLMPSHWMSPR